MNIIFGAGVVGKVITRHLLDNNIAVNYICDNNIEKDGEEIFGVKVIHSGDLIQFSPNDIFYIAVADIEDIVKQLHALGFDDWISASEVLNNADIDYESVVESYEFVDYAVNSCKLCHDNYVTPEKIFFRSVDLIITEKCSLKCKDCSNLMQYYTAPVNYEIDELSPILDLFLSSVDEINEFRGIGGEPFVNKDIGQILIKIMDSDKVRRVVIYTNGTIIPRPHLIPILKDKKVLMLITDYGDLSKNTDKLESMMIDNEINYYRAPAQNWTDCSSITKHNRSTIEQEDIFTRCCCKNLFTIQDGKFYRCPFSSHIDKLKASESLSNDYVTLSCHETSNDEVTRVRSEIHDLLRNRTYLESCDYCDGRFLEDEKIVPGIQTKIPLEYVKVR